MEYKVPSWNFEAEQTLWNFIKSQATKWWLDVVVSSVPQAPSVKKIEEEKIILKKEIKVEENVEEEIKVEKKEEVKKDKKK
jgi:hypothetical protein